MIAAGTLCEVVDNFVGCGEGGCDDIRSPYNVNGNILLVVGPSVRCDSGRCVAVRTHDGLNAAGVSNDLPFSCPARNLRPIAGPGVEEETERETGKPVEVCA